MNMSIYLLAFANLIPLDAKFSCEIFNFAKLVFPFTKYDAVFTSRFFRKYHELSHSRSSTLPFAVILSDSARTFFLCRVPLVSRSIVIVP